MPFSVPIEIARAEFPSFEFVSPLTPSEQKAAFHVRREGKELCLKIISPSYGMDRLQREVLAMQAIDHPNVVRLVEYEFSARQTLRAVTLAFNELWAARSGNAPATVELRGVSDFSVPLPLVLAWLKDNQSPIIPNFVAAAAHRPE